MKHIMMILGVISVVGGLAVGEPRRIQGQNSFVETGVDLPDSSPTWYAPMLKKPYALSTMDAYQRHSDATSPKELPGQGYRRLSMG